jgi:hypothetical protein
VFLTKGSRVFVILLNYRRPGDTLRCLASLRRSKERALHLVIVDNSSGDQIVGRLQHALGPAVPLIVSPENGGYAAGNNIGIRHAIERDADFIWILNPDTEVEPNTLQLLMATMASRPDAGFVGTLNLSGRSLHPTIQFAGGKIDWESGAITKSLGLGRALSSFRERRPFDVDYVAGTSMLVRRRVLEDVGLLPEHYFLYFEDTDLQVRAARQGWGSVLNPLARVWHHQKSGSDLPAPYYTYYYVRSRMLFGREFTQHDDATLEAGLDEYIQGWRSRVAELVPDWLPTYDQLIDWGLIDGKTGRTGPRADVDAMATPDW